MEILAATLNEDDFEYIDPIEYERGMKVYNEKIRQEGIDEVKREFKAIIFALMQEMRETERKTQEIKQKIQEAKQEKQDAKQDMQEVEQVTPTVEQTFKNVIRELLKKGDSVRDIADLLTIDMSTMKRFLKQIKVEDEAAKSTT